MEPRALRRAIAAGIVVLLLAALTAAVVARAHHGGPGTPHLSSSLVRAPAGQRIRVEVLNATKVRGLARRATMFLRDQGFDVVATGTTQPTRDSTMVIDRSSHREWAGLVAKALGATQVVSHPDTSRYLDVTVLLGSAWRPPAEPFYP